jgi:hypothetical protein
LRKRSQRTQEPTTRIDQPSSRDLVIGALLSLAIFALYVITLCPTVYVEDSAEFATAAAVFGVPHPPGYPLYTLLAGVFARLVPIGGVALRCNLFSAVCGAGTAGTVWLLLRWAAVGRLAAFAATVCFAAGRSFWSQALAAEVHTLNGWLLALTLLCGWQALRAPSRVTFALAALTLGLAIGHRNLNLIFVAPLAVVLVRASGKTDKRFPLLLAAGAGLLASALVYLYLPLAARRDPPIAMGAPVTLGRFWSVISARTYVRHLGTGALATDVGRCWAFLRGLPANLGVAVLAVPSGIALLRRRKDPTTFWVVAWMAASCVVFAVFYNVLDVASYFIPAYLALAIAAGLGLQSWSDRWPRLTGPLAVASLAGVFLGFSSVNLRGTTLAGDFGRQLLESSPPRAVVISFSDTETHTLAYAQAVERRRPDVIVVSANEIDDWYVEQLARRHPDVRWPTLGPSVPWLTALYSNVQGDDGRPFCLTKPITFGVPGVRPVPTGLLHCLAPGLTESALNPSLAFWRSAVTPSAAEQQHGDVHLQMIHFDFALARFALAGALAEMGNIDEARAQLRAVVAARPDAAEEAIVEAMKTIGREGHSAVGLQSRAEQALQLDGHDPHLLSLLRL